MTETPPENPQTPNAPQEEQDEVAADSTPEPQLLSPLQQLERERDEFEARYLRAMADYQNLARRSQQNEVTAREQTVMALARRLITVLDHFDHAMSFDPDQTEAADVLKGVGMVHDELISSLKQFGVERLDVKPGEMFDPNRHEAMMRQPHDDLESNQIIMQLQPGYTLADKTLRPAQVTVAE